MKRPKRLILALAPLFAVLFLFEIMPLTALVMCSFVRGGAWSFGNQVELALSACHRGVFVTLLWLSMLTAVIGMAAALPIFRLLQRTFREFKP